MFEIILFFSLISILFFGARKFIQVWKHVQTPEFEAELDKEKIRTLQAAIETREPLLISYDGGTTPGVPKKVYPLQISKDGKGLTATMDLSDKEGAHYRINKITIED